MAQMDEATIARTVYEAFNDRDFDRGTKLVASNGTWTNVPTGETFRGPEETRQNYEQWATAFPDGRCEEIKARGGNGWAVVEFTGRGTNSGPLKTPAGEMPPTGRSVDIPFCDVYEIRDGKIVSSRSYWDMATMMSQLGLMPEVPAGATA